MDLVNQAILMNQKRCSCRNAAQTVMGKTGYAWLKLERVHSMETSMKTASRALQLPPTFP